MANRFMAPERRRRDCGGDIPLLSEQNCHDILETVDTFHHWQGETQGLSRLFLESRRHGTVTEILRGFPQFLQDNTGSTSN
jgi:hypothetical protein